MRYLVLLILLSACASAPQNPQQAVFEVKSSYAIALTTAVAYKRLPDCAIRPFPCSDKAIVTQLQKADNVASAALDAAESAVRTPGFGQDIVSTAAASARSALAAFVSITSSLKVK